MGTEITTALIAFIGATCASLIAIGGVMIGLASSYLLQALQRKWALDDQRRERKRKSLEEISISYKELMEFKSLVYFSGNISAEDKMEWKKFVAKNVAYIPPFSDKELFDLQNELMEGFRGIFAIEGGIEDQLDLFEETTRIGKDFQRRINELIEQTYK